MRAQEELEISANARAVILPDASRDGIISGVKTTVESNVAHFLPDLTGGRYNLARIDENQYKIEVYDREARGWREKGVFSGGTKDQFSLALRLAFALSTIPETRGARPGFIFLDEPLSSFDQRREGFMRLINEELTHKFPQIFVVSHLEGMKEAFPQLMELDAGKIITQ